MNKKILIIEDDVVLQKSLNEYLSSEGFDVVCASDGEEGTQKATSEKPDLILFYQKKMAMRFCKKSKKIRKLLTFQWYCLRT